MSGVTFAERMALREQPTAAPDNADAIIGDIAMYVQLFDDPKERLARQVGMLNAEIRKLCGLVEVLTAQKAGLVGAIGEALDFAEDRADVVDGSYGVPQANAAMTLAQTLSDAIARAA